MSKKSGLPQGSNIVTPLWPTPLRATQSDNSEAGKLLRILRSAELAHFAMHNAENTKARDIATIRYSKMLEALFVQLSAMSRDGNLKDLIGPDTD